MALFALFGKSITTIDGVGPYLSLKLIAECGDDMSLGQVQSILPPGWDWRRRTGSSAAECSRPEGADPAVGRRHFCALLP
ncbi:hypothetical protein IVA96_18355 [Bradyrhizobium sp. 159]|uniref:hypothetical protein n=1 Tax=unclassified Bradyrhizobium TaxID=2631580 RepID=UPI001FF8944D|nr:MULTISPECIES: hypothetical protein [unclassified Bradyrhizobium]MCK1618570.1 hypothetical protein [Bradyrhizobium sp. 159]MCK1758358.1 hypothetical protein [Bradyrhizobium sp. 137]